MTEYERIRQDNIRRNNEVMARLGFSTLPTLPTASDNSRSSCKRKTYSSGNEPWKPGHTRRSPRLISGEMTRDDVVVQNDDSASDDGEDLGFFDKESGEFEDADPNAVVNNITDRSSLDTPEMVTSYQHLVGKEYIDNENFLPYRIARIFFDDEYEVLVGTRQNVHTGYVGRTKYCVFGTNGLSQLVSSYDDMVSRQQVDSNDERKK